MRYRKVFFTLGVAVCAGIASAVPGDPIGDEFLVNDDSSGFQGNPVLAMDDGGDFLVAWNGVRGGVDGIWAQPYHSSGAVDGEVLRLDEPGSGAASDAAIAVSPYYGIYMVAWVSDTGDRDIKAVLFNKWDGYSSMPRFTVNATTAGDQGWPGYPPAIATDRYGGIYVVVWCGSEPGGYGVYGRRFDSGGQPLGDEFRINALPSAAPVTVAVDMADDAAFVVAWEGRAVGGSVNQILARRYDVDGTPLGDEFSVNAPASTPRGSPSVAAARTGSGFTVVWQGSGMDPDGGEIYARRYDAGGAALGAEFQVNTTRTGYQRRPKAAADIDGDLVVMWESLDQDGSDFGVFGQRLLADGTPLGGEFQVNQHAPGAQLLGGVDTDADGDFAAAWGSEGQDGDSYGIYARRYVGPGQVDLSVTLSDDDPVQAGELLRYVVWVNNQTPYDPATGSGWASGIKVDVALPPGAVLQEAGDPDATYLSGGWTCTGSTNVSCVHLETLGLSGSIGLGLSATAPATSGAVSATASVTAAQTEYYPDDNTATEVTAVGDIMADPFSFTPRTGVEPSTMQTSDVVTITGIDTPVSVSVAGGAGSYSLNGQPFTTEYGVVNNGDTLQLRHISASTLNASNWVTVFVGDVEGRFVSTTRGPDSTPDAFAFIAQTDVAPATVVTSNAITVSGIETGAPISVNGGSYSIDGGPFTSAAGTVNNGRSVRVSHTASMQFSTRVDTTLTIGGVSDTFSSTTAARDTTPHPFTFLDQAGVARGAMVTSNTLSVGGINDATPISVTGGSYSVAGAAFTTSPGTVRDGQTVRVQHMSAATFSTPVETVLTIGGVNDTFTSTTMAQDTTPYPFSFPDQVGVARGAVITSSEFWIGGINDAAPISVTGGSYSIDGGAFTTAPGTVLNFQSVRVRHTSAAMFSTPVDTVLTIGGVSDTFTSTTEAEDTTPSAFGFTDQTGVPTGTMITSDGVTIAGINSLASVSVSGGSYSVNGGAFTTSAGTVQAGDVVRVRHVSSSSGGGTVLTTLTVGGVSDTFASTASSTDTTPNPFAFTDVTGVRNNSRNTSNAITVSGINTAVSLTVSGGDAQYSKNGGKYSSAPTTVFSGETVQIRVTAPNSALTTVNVTVTIGGVSDTWSVTTR